MKVLQAVVLLAAVSSAPAISGEQAAQYGVRTFDPASKSGFVTYGFVSEEEALRYAKEHAIVGRDGEVLFHADTFPLGESENHLAPPLPNV